jgi:hypothetical protein
VIFTEVGNRLEGRIKPLGQPHQLNIAPRLARQLAARAELVQIAVDIKLQQIARMIGRPPRRLRSHMAELQSQKIKAIDKGIDHPHHRISRYHIVQDFWKQHHLIPRLSAHMRHAVSDSINTTLIPHQSASFCTACSAGMMECEGLEK